MLIFRISATWKTSLLKLTPNKTPGCNIVLIARKRKKMFQNMKMCITENKANRKFTTEIYFLRKMLIFPDFPDNQPKLPDNSLIFQ